jgi:hypothetical protein
MPAAATISRTNATVKLEPRVTQDSAEQTAETSSGSRTRTRRRAVRSEAVETPSIARTATA